MLKSLYFSALPALLESGRSIDSLLACSNELMGVAPCELMATVHGWCAYFLHWSLSFLVALIRPTMQSSFSHISVLALFDRSKIRLRMRSAIERWSWFTGGQQCCRLRLACPYSWRSRSTFSGADYSCWIRRPRSIHERCHCVTLTNGLLTRAFLLQPDFGTADFVSSSKKSSILRALTQEAVVGLDDTRCFIGGLRDLRIPRSKSDFTVCQFFRLALQRLLDYNSAGMCVD